MDPSPTKILLERTYRAIENEIAGLTKEHVRNQEDIPAFNAVIAKVTRTRKENWQEIVKQYKKVVKSTIEHDKVLLQVLERLKENRIIVMRLMVIEKYLSQLIVYYPLEYKLNEHYQNEDDTSLANYPPHNILFTLKNKANVNLISLSVPMDSFHVHENSVIWHSFAEMMIIIELESGAKHYHRGDFFEDEKGSQEDTVFYVYSLKEIRIVLDKFDSWFGSTLD